MRIFSFIVSGSFKDDPCKIFFRSILEKKKAISTNVSFFGIFRFVSTHTRRKRSRDYITLRVKSWDLFDTAVTNEEKHLSPRAFFLSELSLTCVTRLYVKKKGIKLDLHVLQPRTISNALSRLPLSIRFPFKKLLLLES